MAKTGMAATQVEVARRWLWGGRSSGLQCILSVRRPLPPAQGLTFDYEPTVMCKCGSKATRWIS
uniref:Uncharacterized protein n=1 Tax=Oryza meridionalis TaxID=40149 RepID=A0A0E0CIC8_9ORYZ